MFIIFDLQRVYRIVEVVASYMLLSYSHCPNLAEDGDISAVPENFRGAL